MATVPFVIDGVTYWCSLLERFQIDDWPVPQPPSGRQSAAGRYLRGSLLVGDITDAFAGRVIGPWSRASIADELANGRIRVLHDCEAETRFGFIGAARQRNTITPPARASGGTEVTSATFGGSLTPRAAYNDRPAKFFAGSSVSGMFHWRAEGSTATTVLYSYAQTGSNAFSAAAAIFTGPGVGDDLAGFDYEVHKGALYFLFTSDREAAASNQIYLSTTGNTWAAVASTVPTTIAHLEGSRLLDDGNTLWLIAQGASKRIDLYKSTAANSAGAWTTVAANAAQGQVRSVFKYYDTTGTAQLMFMTEEAVFWIDSAGGKAVRLWDLPYPGRAALVWGGSLYVFMDAMNVIRYTQNDNVRFITPITPGGGQAMPSGKDFRTDADGQVTVTAGQLGPIAVWSGDGPTSGTLNRTLCLQWIENAAGEGWHFLFRRANTTNNSGGYNNRAVYIEPTSGELVWVGVKIVADEEVLDPDSARITAVETDPRLLSANTYETSSYFETPLITVDPTALTTSFWDIFYNTESLTTGVTIQTQYGVNGAVATTTTLESSAITANRATRRFATDATAAGTAGSTQTTAVGLNTTTIRLRHLLAGTATASGIVYNIELSYLKIAPIRWAYRLTVDLEETANRSDENSPSGVAATLKTMLGSTTKLTCSYAEETGLQLLPLPKSAIKILLKGRSREDVDDFEAQGTWQVVLAEV